MAAVQHSSGVVPVSGASQMAAQRAFWREVWRVVERVLALGRDIFESALCFWG